MPQNIEDPRRQVVPRWRPFRVAAHLGLLGDPGPGKERLEPSPGEIEELEAEWHRHRSPSHAANLIDAAIVLNRPEIATEAARFLLSNPLDDSSQSDLARFILGEVIGPEPVATPPDLAPQERHRRIAAARRSLHRQPRNPVLLVDLARDYSALGQLKKAEKAILQAVSLAPDNRFVLRAASRFFLHTHRPDDAHKLLRGADRTRHDPWLLAAEIVAAIAAEKTSRWVNLGRRMIDDGMIEPQHTTELASAIGTIEHSHGNRRQVRRLFAHALIRPTENTVAQASWISRHMPGFEVRRDKLQVPRAYEARAWKSVVEGRYTDAIEMAWKWLRDEPFATRASQFGSGVAAVALGDFQTATVLASAARMANPDDPRLIAQLIYCLASRDDPDEAERLLVDVLPGLIRRNPGVHSDIEWSVIEAADRGLIAYRRGHVEEGRFNYTRAIALARQTGKEPLRAGAFLNFVREEALANPGTEIPWARVTEAVTAFPTSIRPLYERFVQRIGTSTDESMPK